MIVLLRRANQIRLFSALASNDLRSHLQAQIKAAMKTRDSLTSTTLRAVLSEINAADKVAGKEASPSVITDIIRKAMQRRTEAASKFIEAKRADLAQKEQREANILAQFLPPLLSSPEIDAHLAGMTNVVPPESDQRKAQGLLFKQFYSIVDKSSVDPLLVKERVQAFLDMRDGSDKL